MSLSPFPPLTWDDTFWTGTVVLPAWGGFRMHFWQSLTGKPSGEDDGSARIMVATPGNENVPPASATFASPECPKR